jgi:hypothetical protein
MALSWMEVVTEVVPYPRQKPKIDATTMANFEQEVLHTRAMVMALGRVNAVQEVVAELENNPYL